MVPSAPSYDVLPAELPGGQNVACLIPAAIDQDPYWRMTRDIAEKMGYTKPTQIHNKFLPPLTQGVR